MPVKFIAEVSSNHDRDLDRCFAFIDCAAEIGCDAVKFQLFKIDLMFSPEILARSRKHRERRNWELPTTYLPKLAKRCQERNVEFSCTPFYLEAVEELEPFVNFYKIASYELLWDGLLRACAATGKPIVVSTGMATLTEIAHAADVLRNANARDVVLLHCVSAYPTPPHDSNLSAIETMTKTTGYPVGWSDHTVNGGVIHRAIHRWSVPVVEFHLDLDGLGAEFDAGHCWLPNDMERLIDEVRAAEIADGSGMKQPVQSELSDREWRADPSDGLRPLKNIRESWVPEVEEA